MRLGSVVMSDFLGDIPGLYVKMKYQHALNVISWLRLICACLLLIPGILFASSYSFYHQDIPKLVVLEETGDVLTLRGVALHKNFFKDTYIGAFYSHNDVTDAKHALADTGSKRMWFYYLQSDNKPRIYWLKSINENNPPNVIQKEEISISQFLKMIDIPLREGDTLVLDYVPNVGTKVLLKGSIRGIVKGNEFYDLILKTWMGRQPPSEKFRKDLFNLSKGIHL